MNLTSKSLNFARKILKYNPKILNNNQHSCKSHQNHENCSQKQNNPIKPYLHVHDHRKQREIYEKSTKQKLENMKLFKNEGNQRFKNGKYQQAIHFYNKIIIYGDYTFPENKSQEKQMQQLLQQGHCNLGIALVKINDLMKSKQNFQQAIKGPQQRLRNKGYYWLSKCYLSENEYKKAQEQIKKLEESKENVKKEIQELMSELQRKKSEYEKKSQEVYSNMFERNESKV